MTHNTLPTASGPINTSAINVRVQRELAPQIERMKPDLANVLPPHITPDKMARFALNAVYDTPALLECDRVSLLRSVMTAAVLGLEVDAKVGLAYILPFKGKAQFIPGYRGYVTLAQNSGFYVSGSVIREGDEFDFAYGTKQFLHHKPKGRMTGGSRGEIVGAYAIAKNPDGVEIFKVLELEDIYVARNASASYKSHMKDPKKDTPWVGPHAPTMYLKTAIRSLAPQLPLNVQRAAALEGHHERTGNNAYLRPGMAGTVDVVLEDDDGRDTRDKGQNGTGVSYNTDKQPDLASELKLKPVCARCGGKGMVDWSDENGSGLEPCPDCKN